MGALFTKFDCRAFLESENSRRAPAKLAKPAKATKAGSEVEPTLATLAALAGRRAATDFEPPDWIDAHREHSAIEYGGKAPRAWVEGLARLDPTKPPPDISSQRWLRFIDDCSRFLDAGWAARAAELGWGPLDLFGCDRERPFVRIDHLGLLWLLNGGAIIELHRDRAVIETYTGTCQGYRRSPLDIDRVVLAWQLAPLTTQR
jgi:hypothetical protein